MTRSTRPTYGQDLNDRSYARRFDVREGDWLEADGDFDCLVRGALRVVKKSEHGLYIECGEGRHYLDGQLCGTPNREYYLGLYPKIKP
jgi:hypothetical protein